MLTKFLSGSTEIKGPSSLSVCYKHHCVKFIFSKSASQSSLSRLTPTFMKTESSSDVTSVGQWDFEEPFKRTSCSCTSSSNISR